MNNLLIEKTTDTPLIDFNIESGIFKIEGKSYPENTFEIYAPIKEWLKNYFEETTNTKTIINIELVYLNSSSLKAYFDMFDIFEKAHENGHELEINWYYESDDDIMEETGEDFADDFADLNITLHTID